jgi:hypothetical protein
LGTVLPAAFAAGFRIASAFEAGASGLLAEDRGAVMAVDFAIFFRVVLTALAFLPAAADVFAAVLTDLAGDAAFFATVVFFFVTVFTGVTLPAAAFDCAGGFVADELPAFFAGAFLAVLPVGAALMAVVFFVVVLPTAAFFFAGAFAIALRVAMECSLGANAKLLQRVAARDCLMPPSDWT